MYIHAITPVLIMFLCTLFLGSLGGTVRRINLSLRKNQPTDYIMSGRDRTSRISVDIHSQQLTKLLLRKNSGVQAYFTYPGKPALPNMA